MLVPRRVHQRITGLEKKNADWVLRRGGFFFPNYIFLMFHHVARQLVYHFGSSSSRSSWRKSTCWRSWLLGRHAWVFEWRKARGSSRMEQQSFQEELEESKRRETSKHGQRCDPSAWRISQHERISEEGQVVSSDDQHRSRVSSRKACGKDAVWCLGSSWNIGSAGSSLRNLLQHLWSESPWNTWRWWIPSRELTYPTWGKGKSSSNMPFLGDMLIPWRVPFLTFTRYSKEPKVRSSHTTIHLSGHNVFGWPKSVPPSRGFAKHFGFWRRRASAKSWQ